MEASIRKIQILTNRETGLPLFYCHYADLGHTPILTIEKTGEMVIMRARRMLYKVKQNPQRKNRVDIYMGIEQAQQLGALLIEVSDSTHVTAWPASRANPAAAAKGNMRLPNIVWSKSARFSRAAARVDSGIMLEAKNGYINVDFEYPDETHIKMKEHEIHIGIQLNAPSGGHNVSKTVAVDVPEHELQRGRNEKNPIYKVNGDFYLEMTADIAAGLGKLLDEVRA